MEENGVAGKGAAFCTTLLSQRRLELMFGQPDHNPETEGVSCISVGPMISSSPAMQLVELVCHAWKAFLGKQVRDVVSEDELPSSLGLGWPSGHFQ
jgi:hypothetical protein